MDLHGSSFELCIGMGMAAGIDEVGRQDGKSRGSDWIDWKWRSVGKKLGTSEGGEDFEKIDRRWQGRSGSQYSW
jgi:hypothetical protein